VAASPAPATALPVRRNTALLAAALAANSAMLQLSAAVASLTLVLVLDVRGLLGLGPAIVLASGALAALPAGRAMDRIGRVPVLAGGFCAGAVGCALAAAGSVRGSAPIVLLGLVAVGAASGTALLARTAAGDMYPPARRAHGIALVLFGAVFGAILGPLVFSPLLAGRARSTARPSRRSGSPPARSCSSGSRLCSRCARTRGRSGRRSRATSATRATRATPRGTTRRTPRPRRCASCSAARA